MMENKYEEMILDENVHDHDDYADIPKIPNVIWEEFKNLSDVEKKDYLKKVNPITSWDETKMLGRTYREFTSPSDHKIIHGTELKLYTSILVGPKSSDTFYDTDVPKE